MCHYSSYMYTFEMEGDNRLSSLFCRKESTDPTADLRGSSPQEEHQLARHQFKAYSHIVERALALSASVCHCGGSRSLGMSARLFLLQKEFLPEGNSSQEA